MPAKISTMKQQCALLLLACVCAYGAPVEPPSMKPGSCKDPSTLGAAGLALTRINQDRKQGYIFSLSRLSNVNQMQHGPMGVVFYLTMDVLETKCHVLSKRDWKSCEVRQTHDTPVYGQCKTTIYINRVQRIVRLYSYSCSMRPVPASKIIEICPDCPSQISQEDENVLRTMKMALEKYNKESGNSNYFASLNVTRASAQGGIAEFYFVEFTIQETICSNTTDVSQAAKCALVDCEFAHKGHCTGSHTQSQGKDYVTVNCDLFEPEEGEKEKQRHLLGGEDDHSHTHTHEHAEGHDHTHNHTHNHAHDHAHNHTHDQEHAEDHDQTNDHDHSHSHTHEHGPNHTSDHPHNHTHEHDPAHEHIHKYEDGHHHHHHHHHHGNHTHYHEHDHDHTRGHDNTHEHIHEYKDHHHHHHHHHHGNHTHYHVHEHEPDHEHKHKHLHAYEHHHHHHDHSLQTSVKSPQGTVRYFSDLDRPVIMPSFPDEPELERPVIMPVPLPVFPDAPEENEPVILPFPSALSPQCQAKTKMDDSLIQELFEKDPLFIHTADM